MMALSREAEMDARRLILTLATTIVPFAAAANGGLVAGEPDVLWPQWQARISLQSTTASPLSVARLLDSAGAPRVWQGGSVLGDYYFANPGYGSFRASGGLMTGLQGGAPLLSANAGPRLGMAVQGNGNASAGAADSPGTVPYFGFGFSGGAWSNTLSVTADLGLVADRPGAAAGMGRVLFGNQGFENTLREMRLSPVLQLGVRYAF